MGKKNFVITRNVNGVDVSIPLTDTEIYSAYKYQQGIFDEWDIQDMFDGMTDDDIQKTYGIDRAKLWELIPEIAIEMRRNIDKYDMSWEYARPEAVDTVVQEELNGKRR